MTKYSIASWFLRSDISADIILVTDASENVLGERFHSAAHERNSRIIERNFNFTAPENSNFRSDSHISNASYARIDVIESLCEEYEVIIYCDGDILILDKLRMENLISDENVISAQIDFGSTTGLTNPEIFERAPQNNFSARFFNAGFLVVHPSLWKSLNVRNSFYEMLEKHNISCPYFHNCGPEFPNDQCPLNMVVNGQFKRLPDDVNVQKSVFQTKYWDHASMRHYTGRSKFIPSRIWQTDRRERELLTDICDGFDLPTVIKTNDFGITYSLNKIRRFRSIQTFEKLAELHIQ
jgi:lipopolysaccharide biosynthesis glycosyltransferase